MARANKSEIPQKFAQIPLLSENIRKKTPLFRITSSRFDTRRIGGKGWPLHKKKFFEEVICVIINLLNRGYFMSDQQGVALPLLSNELVLQFQSERNLIIAGEINQDLALRMMLLLRQFDIDSHDPIYIYINSPGGSVSAGLSIIDNMRLCKSPIYTINFGLAASMGAVIFACGTKGHRYVLPHSEVMIHQPWRQVEASYNQSDFEREGRHFKRMRDSLEQILSETSGKSIEEMHAACEHDNFLTAEEAIEMGLADSILKEI